MLKRILKKSALWLVILLLAVDIISRFVKPLPNNLDIISFLMAAFGIIIAAIAIVGAVVVLGTWNDIDARAKSITDKYKLDVDQKTEEVNKSIEVYKAAKDEINRRLGQLGEAERTMINLGMLNEGMGSSVKNPLEIAWEKMQRHSKSLDELQN